MKGNRGWAVIDAVVSLGLAGVAAIGALWFGRRSGPTVETR